ncbi:Lipase 2 [Fusarium albosuccineum]|uniref:Lipase 2 n=1 Tax=Fusarium albosuccineum TaxID=1237068 RepID=A0A8H4P8Q4_9HYPO|nr:Lipase 2 [Fusarium albosuccineum]
MGESAGASSVGFHLLAYGGRDDGLFSAAIAQSGGPLSTLLTIRTASERESDFDMVLQETGCANSTDSLACLRKVPAEVLRQAGQRLPISMAVDGDMVRHSGTQLRQGCFVRVPLLIGTTRNEGTSFVQQTAQGPINIEGDFIKVVGGSLGNMAVPKEAIQRWAELYQLEVDAPSDGGLGTVLPNPGVEYGSQYGKTTLWMGDVMFTAGRRHSSQAWADHQVPGYSFSLTLCQLPLTLKP